MTARLAFLGITVFWLTMNTLLWRAEFGARGGDTPVPVALVWHKILTAPDASSLTVYQNGERMGYCEFSTSIGRKMATLDENKPPPEGIVARAGYQIHLAGNVALGDFTNRMKIEGTVRFSTAREWQGLNLKISTRLATVEIRSLATNQTVRVRLTSARETVLDRELTFAELENPATLVRAFAGNFADAVTGLAELPVLAPAAAAQKIQWDARLTRVKIGAESISVFRLETRVLDWPVVVDVSPLGEILRVRLPGGLEARIDEWIRP